MVPQSLLGLLHQAKPTGGKWVAAVLTLEALRQSGQALTLIERLFGQGRIDLRYPDGWRGPFSLYTPVDCGLLADPSYRRVWFRFRHGGKGLAEAADQLAALFETAQIAS